MAAEDCELFVNFFLQKRFFEHPLSVPPLSNQAFVLLPKEGDGKECGVVLSEI